MLPRGVLQRQPKRLSVFWAVIEPLHDERRPAKKADLDLRRIGAVIYVDEVPEVEGSRRVVAASRSTDLYRLPSRTIPIERPVVAKDISGRTPRRKDAESDDRGQRRGFVHFTSERWKEVRHGAESPGPEDLLRKRSELLGARPSEKGRRNVD
jgi:hypothetical protein